MERPRSPQQRDRALDEHLGTVVPSLRSLEDLLYDDYSPDTWGFRRFASLADEEQRAIASDLVLSAVTGVHVNLRALALCDIDLRQLLGPHGPLMPGPDTTVEDLIDSERTHRAVTDFSRAFGSTLDCLAATVVGVLGLPASLQRASGAALLALPELGKTSPADQREARDAVELVLRTHFDAPPSGWVAWALELRDAVVHRGHLTQVLLPRPAPRGPQLLIRSTTAPQYLVRFEPHLRAQPWLPDMMSMTSPGNPNDLIWLAEPAQDTTAELKRRVVELVEAIMGKLVETAGHEAAGWTFPDQQWALSRVSDRRRTMTAGTFRGFDESYPVPPLDHMRVHARGALRLQLAERLRLRVARSGESDPVST